MSNADKSQKTVKPTPKRIREFRKQGKIAFSRELVSVAGMLIGGAVGLSFASRSHEALQRFLVESLRAGADIPPGLAASALSTFVIASAPVAIGAMSGVIVAGGAQLGWPPAMKKLSFNIGKVFSPESFSQTISPKAAAGRVTKATAKVVLVLAVLYIATRKEFLDFSEQPALEPSMLATKLLGAIVRLGTYSVAVLGAIAAVDFFMQRRKINQDMMMTPDEAKREHKQSEGDPHIKGKRRQKMREMANRRLQMAVRSADVIIVNPTHFAVALRYDDNKEGAPRVVAKGADHLAAKIRETARKAGVPILSRPPLTRLIYRMVPEGKEIPAELYKVVAEILAYVYRLGIRRKGSNS